MADQLIAGHEQSFGRDHDCDAEVSVDRKTRACAGHPRSIMSVAPIGNRN